MNKQICTLGGGCFWCLEAVFQNLKGVLSVRSGYSGGTVINPSYEEVCSKQTGHAEVVQIDFDADVVSFETILEVFFAIHDPTTLNRQGNDEGPQYRSVIYFHSEAQKSVAEKVILHHTQQQVFSSPIVTELKQFDVFYPAEEYHQGYFANNPLQSYCLFVVSPKVLHFRERFKNLIKSNV